MDPADDKAVFAAFREAVFDDHPVQRRLRAPLDRDAYAARVVAIGAECGFAFDEAAVRAVLREGEMAWLMQGVASA